jgi:hypothetical protein
MNLHSRLIGLTMTAVVLAACAKAPAPGADPAVDPATAQEEEVTNQNLPEPTVVTPSEDAATQAGILAAMIDTRPECAQFRAPLEEASKATPGSPAANIDMTEIMRQAQAAACAVN